MHRPLVSVVLNCFNSERFVKQAIRSVVEQSYKNWELIVWNNCSSDKTSSIVNSFNDHRIKLFEAKQHTKLYFARNCAIRECNGKLISFIDSDDIWLPEKLAWQVEKFTEKKIGLVHSNFLIRDERNSIEIPMKRPANRSLLPSGFIFSNLLSNYNVGFSTVMLRSDLLPKCMPAFDGRFNIIGDMDLVIKLSRSNFVFYDPRVTAEYRVHGENESLLRGHLEITELEQWYGEKVNDSKYASEPNFRKIQEKVHYLKIRDLRRSGNALGGWQLLKKMEFGIFFVKALLTLILPRRLLKIL